jgi:predicted RNA binding protein YcfA (HicA-like mRNA interferase family)
MKIRDLERHLRGHGCVLFREGGAHTVWLNPANRKIASVPRHREIN